MYGFSVRWPILTHQLKMFEDRRVRLSPAFEHSRERSNAKSCNSRGTKVSQPLAGKIGFQAFSGNRYLWWVFGLMWQQPRKETQRRHLGSCQNFVC